MVCVCVCVCVVVVVVVVVMVVVLVAGRSWGRSSGKPRRKGLFGKRNQQINGNIVKTS